jgi:hypothetical protein
MAAGKAQVRAWLGFESGRALLTVGPQPAIERAPRKLAQLAIRQLDRLAGELAHELTSFCRTQAWVGSLCDQFVSEQCHRFGGIDGRIGGHAHLQVASKGDGAIQLQPDRCG